MSWSKVIERFKKLRWFTPDPFWCHGAAGLSGVVLGLLLTVKALAGDFTLHNSYVLFVYYFATWILMGSTWGFASKLPAYQTIYRCVSLQGLGLLYFGFRFRPNSTFSIEAPEDLVSAIDLAACCCLVAGIIGTFLYAPQIAKGQSKVDAPFGYLALGMTLFSIVLTFPSCHLTIIGESWLVQVLELHENQRLALTAFGFVPATWMLMTVGNFNNLKNRFILTHRIYENCALPIVSMLLLLCFVACEIHLGSSARTKLLMTFPSPVESSMTASAEKMLDITAHTQWVLQWFGYKY